MRKEVQVLNNYVRLNSVNPYLAKKYQDAVAKNKSDEIPLGLNLKKKKSKNKKSCYDKIHKPTKQVGKMVGVEIECYIPKKSFFSKEQMSDMDYLMEDLDDGEMCIRLAKIFDLMDLPGVSVSEDGSLDYMDKSFGAEIQVMFPVNKPEVLIRVMDVLTELNAFVNTNCGLHVHVDIRNHKTAKKRKEAFNHVEKALPIIGSLVKSYRCYSEYSSILEVDPYNCDKNAALQLNNYLKTIEFRIHQGSVNLAEILAWTNFCFEVTHSKELWKSGPMDSLDELVKHTNLAKEHQKVLKKKYSQSRRNVIARQISRVDKDSEVFGYY